MKEYINEPVPRRWTDEDIIKEYIQCQDKRKVAKIFDITAKEVGELLKRNSVV